MWGVRKSVRAPEISGRAWLNTGGKELHLADLRGKIVLLDFWTFCCINCLHVLDEIRPLEARFDDVLVVIGVHSPKFEHEQDPQALADAVERYGVTHAVLDDPEMSTWRNYAVRAWPTLAVVDPEGYLVASMSGEGHAGELAVLFDELIARHEAPGILRRGAGSSAAPSVATTALRFPGKAVVSPVGSYFVSSPTQHAIVEMAPDAATVLRRIGSGQRGRSDGPGDRAEFSEPHGLLLLPPDVAQTVGYDLVVADTVNHLLRGVRLDGSLDGTGVDAGVVTTVAGTGRQWRSPSRTTDALAVDLSSPWDLAWYEGLVIIAMAGIHQLWWFDPISGTVGAYAGTAREALRDGPLGEACLAQPSGLSVAGERLWIADSETSSLRWIEHGRLHTAIGKGLFDFGLVDGDADGALLQHPLGVLALGDGSVLIADTYNGALRRFNPVTNAVTTLLLELDEPSDVVVAPDGEIVVVESAAHRLRRFPASILGGVEEHLVYFAPGPVTLDVIFVPNSAQKLDETFGPSTCLEVSCSPPSFLQEGAGISSGLSRHLVLADSVGDGSSGVLHVTAQAATCDSHGPHPACYLHRQTWDIEFVTSPNGENRLSLVLQENG